MKNFLPKLAIISGLFVIVTPLVMVLLWGRYVREQEQLEGTQLLVKSECEPYNMSLDRADDGKYRISWQTKGVCESHVLLASTYTDFANMPYQVSPITVSLEKNSYQVILQAQDEIDYRYAVIVSNGEWYGLQGSPFLLEKR